MVPRDSLAGTECYLTSPDTIRSVYRLYPYSELMPGLQPRDMSTASSAR